MATEISICNLALMALGKKPISSFDTSNASAEACAIAFPVAREEVLSAHPWNFATRTVELAQISGADYPNYDFAYSYPSDCLRALMLVNDASDDELVYKVALATDGETRVILCDYDPATLEYVALVTTAGAYSPGFCQALAYNVAAKIAQTLTGSEQLMGNMLQLYERALGRAAALDCMEGRQGPATSNPYVDARL